MAPAFRLAVARHLTHIRTLATERTLHILLDAKVTLKYGQDERSRGGNLMNPTPTGWPRISTALYYEEAAAAIDWLCRAFGFEVQMKIDGEGGRIEHSELVFGGGLIMVSEASKNEKFPYRRSPKQSGGANTQNLFVYVDDVDAHCRRARAAGAKITMEPQTVDYGADHWSDRHYECSDIGGHHWWFAQRLRSAGG